MFKRLKDIKRVLETFNHINQFKHKFPINRFATSSNPVVEERLKNLDEDIKAKYSWLDSEDSMRKHMNIVEWDEIEKEEKFDRINNLNVNTKKPYVKKDVEDADLKKLGNDFRQKIFDISNRNRVQKFKKNDDDYEIPEEVSNFERTIDLSKFKNEDFYERFNKDTEQIQTQVCFCIN